MSDDDLVIHPNDELRKQTSDLLTQEARPLGDIISDQQMNVVCIDESGSMGECINYGETKQKIDLMKNALERWIKSRFQKTEKTRLGLVAFSSRANVLIEISDDERSILSCVRELRPRANTAMDKGLQESISILKKHNVGDNVPRVLLISDGEPDSQPRVNAVINQHKNSLIIVDTIFIGPERKETCWECNGDGVTLGVKCRACNGRGHRLSAYLEFMKTIAETTGGVFEMITSEKDFDKKFEDVADRQLLLGPGAKQLKEKEEKPRGVIHL